MDHFGGTLTNTRVQLFVRKVFFLNVTMNSETGIHIFAIIISVVSLILKIVLDIYVSKLRNE